MESFTQDDMLFVPYMCGSYGWQCKINTKLGVISVRFGGHGLLTDEQRPYEVYYPTEDSPSGFQTADDIWNYINKHIELTTPTHYLP